MFKKIKLFFGLTLVVGNFEVFTKVNKYLAFVTEEDINYDNIKELYDLALLYLKAKNIYSTRYTAIDALKHIYNKCKDNPQTDRATFAKVMYVLANAYFLGTGTDRDKNKGYELYHNLYNNFKDFLTEDELNHVRSCLGDQLYWGFANVDKNWTKAMPYYLTILAYTKNTSPETIAWAQARIADAYREGNGLEQSDKLALEWYQMIIDNDTNIQEKAVIGWAKYWIAYAYQHGKGIEQDLNKALDMFTSIAEFYTSYDPAIMQFAQMRIDELNQNITSNN